MKTTLTSAECKHFLSWCAHNDIPFREHKGSPGEDVWSQNNWLALFWAPTKGTYTVDKRLIPLLEQYMKEQA